MTDTTAPLKPKWQLILGLLPSFNQSLIVLVTAVASVGTTLLVQHYTAKPEIPKPAPVERVIVEKPAPVDLTPLTGKMDELLKEMREARSSAGEPKRKRGLK